MKDNVTIEWCTRNIRRVRKILNRANTNYRKASSVSVAQKWSDRSHRASLIVERLEKQKRKLERERNKTNPILRLMEEHLEFTAVTFPEATAVSGLLHLQEEITEVAYGIEHYPGTKALAIEYADCFMCLLDSAKRAGVTPVQLMQAFAEKLEVNRIRKWVKNDDNTYSHVKLKTA